MYTMIEIFNRIKKRLAKYRYIKIIYKSFFLKGFFYQHVQEYFTNIKVRNFISKIEKKIFNLLYKKYYYKSDLEKAKINTKLLNEKGITDKFELIDFEKYKKDILDYFNNNKVFFDKNPEVKFFLKERDPSIKMAYYEPTTVSRCPYIFDIINDHTILSTAANYFNSPFKLDYASVWWSFKNDDVVKEKTQSFHRDLDSFNLLKFFIYLSDVDENSGANQFIKYSHLNSNYEKNISRKTIPEHDLKENLKKNIFTFTGKSGSVIAANTFGLHRGKTPKSNNRLMLVLSFSLIGTFYGPTKPFLNINDIITNKKNLNKFINKRYII